METGELRFAVAGGDFRGGAHVADVGLEVMRFQDDRVGQQVVQALHAEGPHHDEQGGAEPPSEAEMRSQAQRMIRIPPPLVVRVPENSTLNPNGTLAINELVPGIFIPLQASLPGRTVSQMQKLDTLTVTETADEGEEVQVSLSPAPNSREEPPYE